MNVIKTLICLVSIVNCFRKQKWSMFHFYKTQCLSIQTCLRWSYRPLLCHTAFPQALPEGQKVSINQASIVNETKENICWSQHCEMGEWISKLCRTITHNFLFFRRRCQQQTFHLIIFLILSDSINWKGTSSKDFTFHPPKNNLLKDSLGMCIQVRIFVYCKPFRSGAEKGDFHKFYACTSSLLQKTIRD